MIVLRLKFITEALEPFLCRMILLINGTGDILQPASTGVEPEGNNFLFQSIMIKKLLMMWNMEEETIDLDIPLLMYYSLTSKIQGHKL